MAPALSLSVVVAAYLSACGGDSFQSAAGGSSSGGAPSSAGASGSGGKKGTAGAPSAMGGKASTGAAATGGEPDAQGGTDANAGAAGATAESAYRAAILADKPLVYWRMGIERGRTVPDETGGGNDLVLQGTGHVLGVKGALDADADGAIGFDGSASFAIASDARALDFEGNAAFTLECWAKWSSGSDSYFRYLMSNVEGSANARNGYALYVLPETNTDTPRSVFEYDVLAADLGVWGALPAENSWAHYAAVYDGARATLYVNGTLEHSSAVAVSIVPRSGPFAVARSSGGGEFFKGALDELAVYPRALSAAVIARHFGYAQGL